MTAAKYPPKEFWDTELEMQYDHLMGEIQCNGFVDKWIEGRTGRQLKILCQACGITANGSTQHNRELFRNQANGVEPYILAERFSFSKSQVAVSEFATRVLPQTTLELCRKGEDDEFDTRALVMAIFSNKWSDLRTLYHLEKIHKSGFARMELTQPTRKVGTPLKDFLTPEKVKSCLARFDAVKNDGLATVLRDIIEYGDRMLVFIRRADRPRVIVDRSGTVLPGYAPEWIILDFSANAKRVRIASHSNSIPLDIANRIATAYFGKDVEYDNESEITYPKQLEFFLANIKHASINDAIQLVELVAVNSKLESAPKITITQPDNRSIGRAIDHFETSVGALLTDIHSIKSIKVLFKKKRVSLIFDPGEVQSGNVPTFVVRYSDSRLNEIQRRQFEDLLKDTHGITILSTEKRFKQSA